MAEALWVIFELIIGVSQLKSKASISRGQVAGIICTVVVVVGILIYLNNPQESASNIY